MTYRSCGCISSPRLCGTRQAHDIGFPSHDRSHEIWVLGVRSEAWLLIFLGRVREFLYSGSLHLGEEKGTPIQFYGYGCTENARPI